MAAAPAATAPSKTTPTTLSTTGPVPPARGAVQEDPTPPPAAKPAQSFASLDEDLTAAMKPPAAPKAKPSTKVDEPPKEAAAPPAPADKPPEKPAETGGDENEYLLGGAQVDEPAASKPAEKLPDESTLKTAPHLRHAYQQAKTRIAELEKEVQQAKAKPVDQEERATYTKQIAQLKKELEETAATVKSAAYEQSPEYKERFEKPFVEAWDEGVQQVAALTVTDGEGNTRKGTSDDFQAIMREPDNERAATLAQEMFGPNAFYVLSQRRDIIRLNNARMKALQDYRANLGERTKAEMEAAKKTKEEREARMIQNATMFRSLNEQAATKYPQLFAPEEGDEEGNKILAKGYADADLAFSNPAGMTDAQKVRLHSAIRNRAAGFGRLVYRLKQKDAKIAELQGVIDELRGSTPGAGQVKREEASARPLTADEEFEAAAKRMR